MGYGLAGMAWSDSFQDGEPVVVQPVGAWPDDIDPVHADGRRFHLRARLSR